VGQRRSSCRSHHRHGRQNASRQPPRRIGRAFAVRLLRRRARRARASDG
jgi:hypothetical protein